MSSKLQAIDTGQTFWVNTRLTRSNHHQEFYALRLELIPELENRLNRVIKLCAAHIQRRRLHQEFHVLPVEKPTAFACPQNNLFAGIFENIPHRQLILGSERKHKRVFIFNLVFERTQIATGPHAIMLDTANRAPDREMPEFSYHRLQRRIHSLEGFRFIFESGHQGIRELQ